MQTVTELADQLAPFWQRDLDALRIELSGSLSATGASGGGETITRHDLLGAFHQLPVVDAGSVLAGPVSTTGEPSFRALTISDINAALTSRSVLVGSGLSGGGNLSADVTVSVNQGFSFVWTAAHTFNSAPSFVAGASVNGSSALTFGGDVSLSRSAADLLALGANDSIGTASFTSGFAGSGWRVNYAALTGYSAEVDNLVVRQQMRVYELLIQKIRSGNGSYLFAPGGKVSAVSGGPTYTLTFDTDHGLASNGTTQKDLVRAQKFDLGLGGVYTSVLQIESIISTTQLTATVVSGAAPALGYEYVRFGNTGDTNRQGGVYVTADDTNAPYIDVFDGVTSSADWQSTTKTKVRLGKLNGITDALFGPLTGYGLYTQSGYFTGGIRATSGRIDGVLDIGTSGGIYQGTGSFATPTTGLKLWNDGGVGRMGGWSGGAQQWSINTSGQFVAGTVSYSGGYGSAQTDDRLRISASGARFGVLPFVDNGHTIKHIEWANGITYVGKSTGPMPYFNTYIDEPYESGAFQTSWAYWDTHARWALSGAEIELISDVKSSLGVREEYIIMRGLRVNVETSLNVSTGINVGTATGSGIGEVRGKNSADALLGWVLDSGNTAAQIASLYFADRGTTKWALGKNAANNLLITESGVSDRMTFAAGGTITATGLMRVSRNSQAFDLVGTDHVYMGWYPDGDGGGRKAYMGFASSGDNNLSIINEISGSDVVIAPTGTASVLLGSASTHTVGIGTSSPAQKVHIVDSGSGWVCFQFSGLTTATLDVGVAASTTGFASAYGGVKCGNGPVFAFASGACAPTSSNATIASLNSGADVLRIQTDASRNIQITRPTGSATWDGVLWIHYR